MPAPEWRLCQQLRLRKKQGYIIILRDNSFIIFAQKQFIYCSEMDISGKRYKFTNRMNIEEFRTYCLSFDGVQDKMPFGKAASDYDRNLLVFYVADKWFCFVNIEAWDFCTIKCRPEQIADLQSRYEGITPAYHMNKKHWISVCFDQDVPDNTIKALVRQAYDLVVACLSKKEKESLQTR